MKTGFYPKLAWNGIGKNKKMYLPYILTCTGMIMMHYIVTFLSVTPVLNKMSGGTVLKGMLGLGSWVIGIFAVIFLFYTNSFLIRRRKKEFGLYNILGMGKFNIGRILVWETLIITAISLAGGLILGIVFSKFAELGLVNIMGGKASFTYTVSLKSVLVTLALFCAIFLLIFLNSLRQIHTANPIALLHSENVGEKPPKANWFFGIAGFLILGSAYYIAISIKDPVAALVWFFVAVIMVIVGTYLLFISGSVLLCRILQKRKNYYYKTKHFVSVSSMAYRMKRNGAGLASICILATMVLVMISSSSCLYFGSEDSLRTRYPRDIMTDICFDSNESFTEENISEIKNKVDKVAVDKNIDRKNFLDYRYVSATGMLNDGVFETDVSKADAETAATLKNVYQLYFIDLKDYNRMANAKLTLNEGEAAINAYRAEYDENFLKINNGATYKIVNTVAGFEKTANASVSIMPSIFLIVPDIHSATAPLSSLKTHDDYYTFSCNWTYGFDTTAKKSMQRTVTNGMRDAVSDFSGENMTVINYYSVDNLEMQRDDYYAGYGGLFFLGIMLSIVFLFATVLIVYYKQVSEGYEDQSRFEIMQKVGMTKKDIRTSINSQMLTVFFMPLIAAVLHLAFAFPIIRKLLVLFNLTNLSLFLLTAAISVVVFAIFYILVYRITTNAYYSIAVSANEE